MLKKLVKYGNSNALILDKTILALLGLEEGAPVKMTIHGNQLVITSAKDVDVQDKVELDFLNTLDALPEDKRDLHEAMFNKTLKDRPITELTSDQYEKQKDYFSDFFQKEVSMSFVMDLSSNPKIQKITEDLMKQYTENKIDMNEYQRLLQEEVKKIDHDLYLKMKTMHEGLAEVSKES